MRKQLFALLLALFLGLGSMRVARAEDVPPGWEKVHAAAYVNIEDADADAKRGHDKGYKVKYFKSETDFPPYIVEWYAPPKQ